MVVMMIFTMMALGLNFVVGYAGLLDLGYVAFYAMGAYMAGWFASSQFATHRIHFGAVGITPSAPGFHISIWLILLAAGLVDGVRRRAHRPADAAPARRLPRDRHARFRRDHPADRAQRRRLLRHRLQPHRGHAGPDADRRPGLRQLDPHAHRPARPTTCICRRRTSTRRSTGPRCSSCSSPCSARSACATRGSGGRGSRFARTRSRLLRWACRSCARRRGRTRPARSSAAIAGAYFASFKSATFPDDFFFNISVFILCMIILGGIGNIPGVIFGACFLAYLNQEGLSNIGGWLNGHFGPGGTAGRGLAQAGRRSAVQLRDLRVDPRRRHAPATRGPDTEPAPRGGVPRGRPRPAALRRAAQRADGAARGHGAAQGVRRPRRGRRASTSRSRSVRSRASSARTARGRRRSSTCSRACTSRPRAGSCSPARTSPASRRTRSRSAASAARSRTSASSRT